MSIESVKGEKKRNENDKPSAKNHRSSQPEGRFSVEMWSVRVLVNAHGGCHRFHHLLLCSPIVQIASTFCTNDRESVLTPLAFRDIRRFARDHPSVLHDVAERYRERSCRQSTSTTRDRGRMMDRGWADRRLDGLKEKGAISEDVLPQLQR